MFNNPIVGLETILIKNRVVDHLDTEGFAQKFCITLSKKGKLKLLSRKHFLLDFLIFVYFVS